MAQWASSRVLGWWPILLAPTAIVLVYLTRDTALGTAVRAHDGGPIPPTIPLVAAGVAFVGVAFRRNPLLWLLGALGVLFFLREASVPGTDDHLPGIKKGVYVGLVLLVVWSFAWRARLRLWVRRGRLLPGLTAMWGTYVLSQVIARGGLKFVSDVSAASGQKMRTPMEESCETLGHLLLLGVVVAACLTRRPGTVAAGAEEPCDEGGDKWPGPAG
ncbi:hypothetical protein OT109_07575 [Phycisphaeraceae bacterium D3-23]